MCAAQDVCLIYRLQKQLQTSGVSTWAPPTFYLTQIQVRGRSQPPSHPSTPRRTPSDPAAPTVCLHDEEFWESQESSDLESFRINQTQTAPKQNAASPLSAAAVVSSQSLADTSATSVASQWPIFPAARFLLASAGVNEELRGERRARCRSCR